MLPVLLAGINESTKTDFPFCHPFRRVVGRSYLERYLNHTKFEKRVKTGIFQVLGSGCLSRWVICACLGGIQPLKQKDTFSGVSVQVGGVDKVPSKGVRTTSNSRVVLRGRVNLFEHSLAGSKTRVAYQAGAQISFGTVCVAKRIIG